MKFPAYTFIIEEVLRLGFGHYLKKRLKKYLFWAVVLGILLFILGVTIAVILAALVMLFIVPAIVNSAPAIIQQAQTMMNDLQPWLGEQVVLPSTPFEELEQTN